MTASSPEALVMIEDLSWVASSRAGGTVILGDVSFAVPRGSRFCIAGPRGSGKSALLQMLAGLDIPSTGSVTVDGRSIARMDADSRTRWRSRTVGFISSVPNLTPGLSVEGNVVLALELARV